MRLSSHEKVTFDIAFPQHEISQGALPIRIIDQACHHLRGKCSLIRPIKMLFLLLAADQLARTQDLLLVDYELDNHLVTDDGHSAEGYTQIVCAGNALAVELRTKELRTEAHVADVLGEHALDALNARDVNSYGFKRRTGFAWPAHGQPFAVSATHDCFDAACHCLEVLATQLGADAAQSVVRVGVSVGLRLLADELDVGGGSCHLQQPSRRSRRGSRMEGARSDFLRSRLSPCFASMRLLVLEVGGWMAESQRSCVMHVTQGCRSGKQRLFTC